MLIKLRIEFGLRCLFHLALNFYLNIQPVFINRINV